MKAPFDGVKQALKIEVQFNINLIFGGLDKGIDALIMISPAPPRRFNSTEQSSMLHESEHEVDKTQAKSGMV